MSNIFNLLFWNNKSVFYNLQIGFNKRILERFWFFYFQYSISSLISFPRKQGVLLWLFQVLVLRGKALVTATTQQQWRISHWIRIRGGYHGRRRAWYTFSGRREENHTCFKKIPNLDTFFLNLFFVSNLYDPNLEQTIF